MKRALVLFVAVFACACADMSELPRVAVPPIAEVTSDDLEVFSSAWSAALHAEYRNTDGERKDVVTPDRTIRACEVPEYQPFAYACIDARDLLSVDGYERRVFGVSGPTVYRGRNTAASQIRGGIRGTELVPADRLLELLRQPRWPWNLSDQFAGKRHVAMFSTPAYFSTTEAVVYILHVAGAASLVHLARDGRRWKVRAVQGLRLS